MYKITSGFSESDNNFFIPFKIIYFNFGASESWFFVLHRIFKPPSFLSNRFHLLCIVRSASYLEDMIYVTLTSYRMTHEQATSLPLSSTFLSTAQQQQHTAPLVIDLRMMSITVFSIVSYISGEFRTTSMGWISTFITAHCCCFFCRWYFMLLFIKCS